MNLNIKQKLTFIIIISVFLTGLSITLGYSYLTIQQTNTENQLKFEIAKQGIDERLKKMARELDLKYSTFQQDRKLNANIYNIINGRFLEFHMFPRITNLAEYLTIKNFGFYYSKTDSEDYSLHLYHSEKLGGNVIVDNGQHKLYLKNHFGSDFIDNFALFPEKLPQNRKSKILLQDGDIIYQYWRPYRLLTNNDLRNENKIIGYFNLQKIIDFDIDKFGHEIGVEFVLYDNKGKIVFGTNTHSDLTSPFPNNEIQLQTRNKSGDTFETVIRPFEILDEKIGFISINVSSDKIASKLNNSIWLMGLIALTVVIIILAIAQSLTNKITSPILELANASLALATGNLDKNIVIKSNDELGILASNFNSMRHSIQSQLKDLKKEINERKIAQERVQVLSQAVEQSPISVIITSPTGEIEYVNSSFEKASGYSSREALGKQVYELGAGINLESKREELYESLLKGNTWEKEMQSRKKNGELYWERVHVAPVFDKQGNTTHYLSVREDITLRKEHEEHIYRQAHYDTLTELPNRFLALDRLEKLVDEAERKDKLVAVVFLDLDGFKKVNDTLGHEVGDKLLVKAANRLQRVVRKPDTVARLGGDEFVILLGGLTAISNVGAIVEKILHKLQQVFEIDGRELILTASAGISIYPTDGDNTSQLLRNADSAMYHSKENGRNKFSFFARSMNEEIARQLVIEEQLRGALERNELTVFYQSQIDMRSEKIIGAEALLRWTNQELGFVSPAEFIPVAEQTGIIVQLGNFVLQQALEMVARWKKEFLEDFRIAVNLSPRQFHEPDLVEHVARSLKKYRVDSSSLELEITEGVLMGGNESIEKALSQLSDLGICIAMDDFGTGYSSLSYLRKFPFDVLKIDRTFVNDVTNSSSDRELVNATITMSHGLGLKVVAEGIETIDQYNTLKILQCDFAQGFLFSKPMPENELIKLAKSKGLKMRTQ